MTATTLSKLFLKWWQKENPEGRIYRNNAGCFKTAAGNWIRYGIPNKGGSDFIAFLEQKIEDYGTEFYFFTAQFYEIKTKNDHMSKYQINFANMITKMCGDYFIVHENIYIKRNDCCFNYPGEFNENFYIEKWSVK